MQSTIFYRCLLYAQPGFLSLLHAGVKRICSLTFSALGDFWMHRRICTDWTYRFLVQVAAQSKWFRADPPESPFASKKMGMSSPTQIQGSSSVVHSFRQFRIWTRFGQTHVIWPCHCVWVLVWQQPRVSRLIYCKYFKNMCIFFRNYFMKTCVKYAIF